MVPQKRYQLKMVGHEHNWHQNFEQSETAMSVATTIHFSTNCQIHITFHLPFMEHQNQMQTVWVATRHMFFNPFGQRKHDHFGQQHTIQHRSQ